MFLNRKLRKRQVAIFKTVTFKQYCNSLKEYCEDIFNSKSIGDHMHDYINLDIPRRKTKNAAGYDFDVPFDFTLKNGETICIPTGIKCNIDLGWVLIICVRSGCGKYRVQLDDQMPIIDGDYFDCEKNEGNIIIQLTNDNKDGKDIKFNKNTSFIQGILIPYGLDKYDYGNNNIRRGGFGSTNGKN